MAELAIEPIELPPGRVEELTPVGAETKPETAPQPNGEAGQAAIVNGPELLQTPPKQDTKPDRPPSPWEGKSGRHPKACYCSQCERTRKIKELVDGKKPDAPQGTAIPKADFSDISLPPGTANAQPGAGPAPTGDVRPDYLAMAKVTFGMSEGLLCTVFGPEWKRENDDEMLSVAIPLSVCLEKWGMSDLPPGYVLCFVCLAYAGKRMNKPTTKDKLARGWLWLKSKFARRKKTMSVNVEQKESK